MLGKLKQLEINQFILVFLTALILFKPAPGILFGEISVKGILLLVLLISFGLVLIFLFNKKIPNQSYMELITDKTVLYIILSSVFMMFSIVVGSIKEPENATIMNIVELYRYAIYISFYLIARYAIIDSTQKLIRNAFIMFIIIELFGVLQAFNIFNINNHFGLLYTTSESLHFMLVNQHRVPSTLQNPNMYGSFILIITALLLAYFTFYRSKKIVFPIFLISLTFISVFLTTSRTAVITVAGLIVYWLLFNVIFVRKDFKRILTMGIGILALFIVISFVLIPQIKYLDYAADQILSTINNDKDTQEKNPEETNQEEETPNETNSSAKKIKESMESVSSFKNRYYYWDLNYKKFLESPIVGMGPMKEGFISFADNSYLYIMARYGIVGLLLFLGYFGYVYIKTIRSIKVGTPFQKLVGQAINLTIVGYAVMGVVSESWFNVQSMTFLFILIGLYFNMNSKEIRGQKE